METTLVAAILQFRMRPYEGDSSVELAPSFIETVQLKHHDHAATLRQQ